MTVLSNTVIFNFSGRLSHGDRRCTCPRIRLSPKLHPALIAITEVAAAESLVSGDPQTTAEKTAVLRPDGYGDRRRSHGTDRTFVAAVLTCGPKGLLSRDEPMSRDEPNRGCRGDFVRCCATDVCPSAGQNPESIFFGKSRRVVRSMDTILEEISQEGFWNKFFWSVGCVIVSLLQMCLLRK